MKCRNCKNELFKIEHIKYCGACEYNGAYDEDEEEYTYDQKKIKDLNLERNEAAEDGQCSIDSCWDSGCYMFSCSECGEKSNLAVMEE